MQIKANWIETIQNKMKIFRILILCTICISGACIEKRNKGTDDDSFYKEKGDWDTGRISLIKPYEAIISNKEEGWGIGLEGIDGDTGFGNIRSINIVDGMILIYSVNSILHGIDKPETWHIIIPKKQVEKGFDKHQDYLNYLVQLGINKEPKLHDIEMVAAYFDQNNVIEWNNINDKNL